ncbi:right-handed parallel beta-helix repeat-containing protein [Corallococcus interemptor]|nr:right-handed parallel beta-helix repeat-containing protein [Corallococcus interemptor]
MSSKAALLDFQVELPDKDFLSAPALGSHHVSHEGADTTDCGPVSTHPCKTLRYAMGKLPAGYILYVHGSPTPYEGTFNYVDLTGTATTPRRVIGVDSYQHKARIIPYGGKRPFSFGNASYWILKNLIVDCQDQDYAGIYISYSDHIAVQDSIIERCQKAGVSVLQGSHVTIEGNTLSKNLGTDTVTRSDGRVEVVRADGNGVTISRASHHIHVLKNYSFDNSGDSVQCQGSEQEDPLPGGGPNVALNPRHITIEGNDFHDNMENAVDIKSCNDVLITGANRFYNLYAAEEWHDNTPICGGAAVIVHYGATRVRIEDATIFDSGIGIELGRFDLPGASDIVIRRNQIHNMNQNQVVTWPRQQKKFNCGDGITVYRAANVEIYHNTLHKLPHSGIQVHPSSNGAGWEDARDIRIWNNIVSEVDGLAYFDPADTEAPFTRTTRTGGTLFFQPAFVAGVFQSENNLFYHSTGAKFRLDGTAGLTFAQWKAQTSFDHAGTGPTASAEGNPSFRNGLAGDLRLKPGSAGIDTALPDTTNVSRRCGSLSQPDRGAVESDCATSATPSPLWGIQRGTPVTDRLFAVTTNSVGDIFYAGESDGDFGFTNSGGWDAVVGRYSVTGGQGWTRQMGTSSSESANGITVDALDNVFIAGSAGGNIGAPPAGGGDAYVVKYDKNGNRIWKSQLGTTASESFASITSDGTDLYAAGSTRVTQPTYGPPDYYLARLHADGTVAWTRQTGGSGWDELTGIAYSAVHQSIFVVGHGNGGSSGGGISEIYLARYALDGTLVWEARWNKPSPTYLNVAAKSVAVDGAGNVYVGGWTTPFSESYRPLLLKFDGASGTLQWTREWHEQGFTNATIWSVAVAPDGHIYASGSAGNWMSLWKFDSAGIRVWQPHVGEPGGPYTTGMGVAVDVHGDPVMVGSTFGDIFMPSQGGPDDAWIVKYPGD